MTMYNQFQAVYFDAKYTVRYFIANKSKIKLIQWSKSSRYIVLDYNLLAVSSSISNSGWALKVNKLRKSPSEIIIYLKPSGDDILKLTIQKIVYVPLLRKKWSRCFINSQVSSSRTPVLVTDLQHVRLSPRSQQNVTRNAVSTQIKSSGSTSSHHYAEILLSF